MAAIRQGKSVRENRVTVRYSQIRDFTPLEFSEGVVQCGMMKEKRFLQTDAELDRFKGVEDEETMVCDGTTPQIMRSTNLMLKAVCVPREMMDRKRGS